MVLNSFFAWNMSAEEVQDRFQVKRNEYYAALAEELLAYVDNTGGDNMDQVNSPRSPVTNGHNPMPVDHKDRMRCAVCKLEENWMDACNMKRDYGSGSRQQRHLARCNMCGITAHSLLVSWHRKIFNIDALKGMSCFEIAHSDHCMGLWIGKGDENNMMIHQGKTVKKQAYRVSIAHPLYISLMNSYGFTPNPRNSKKRRGEGSVGDVSEGYHSEYDDVGDEDEEEDED